MKFLILLVLVSLSSISKNSNNFKEDLEVRDSKILFSDNHGYLSISVLGKVANSSENRYKGLVISIEFFDENEVLIDAFTNELYSEIIPANDQVTIRLQGNAARLQESYVTHKIRILDAELKMPCQSKQGLRSFLSDWGGIIFVILFLMYMLYAGVHYQKSLKQDKQFKKKFMQIAIEQTKQSEKIIKHLKSKDKDKNI